MPRLSPRVAGLLASARPLLNERFARLGRGRSGEALLRYLGETVAPLVDAVPMESAGAVLFSLFDAGLLGAARGLIGELHASAFETSLLEHAGALAPFVARAPARVVRALGNGFYQLAHELGEDAARVWLGRLAGVAPHLSDVQALEAAGLVLAWQSGLAEAREAALVQVAALPEMARITLLGEATRDTKAVSADPARRFCTPGTTAALGPLEIVAELGGFLGFGGPFTRPPRVYVAGRALLATDEDVTLRVFADVYGARLVPTPAGAAESGSEPVVRVALEGRVDLEDGALCDPRLRGAVSCAACEGIVAVTLRASHAVFVVARREERA